MAQWFYKYLRSRLVTFDVEMRNASTELACELGDSATRFEFAPVAESPRPMFGANSFESVSQAPGFSPLLIGLILAASGLKFSVVGLAGIFFLPLSFACCGASSSSQWVPTFCDARLVSPYRVR